MCVGNVSIHIQIDKVNVPNVLVTTAGGFVIVLNARLVVETEVEVVSEILQIFNWNHHLTESLAAVFVHEGL